MKQTNEKDEKRKEKKLASDFFFSFLVKTLIEVEKFVAADAEAVEALQSCYSNKTISSGWLSLLQSLGELDWQAVKSAFVDCRAL